MVNPTKYLGVRHSSCFARTLQLVANGAIAATGKKDDDDSTIKLESRKMATETVDEEEWNKINEFV